MYFPTTAGYIIHIRAHDPRPTIKMSDAKVKKNCIAAPNSLGNFEPKWILVIINQFLQ